MTEEQIPTTELPVEEELALKKEIEKLRYQIRVRRKKLRKKNKPLKKRGRKPGQTGIKCQKDRYKVERVISEENEDTPWVTVETLGNFKTLGDIATLLNLSYGQVRRAYKNESKLSETLYITNI